MVGASSSDRYLSPKWKALPQGQRDIIVLEQRVSDLAEEFGVGAINKLLDQLVWLNRQT